MSKRIVPLLVAAALCATSAAVAQDAAATTATKAKVKAGGLDPKLTPYVKVSGEVSGSIKSEGSDSMNNLMTLWAEGFRKMYPNVEVEIQGKGSSTAPIALTEGTANFGPMSRSMKPAEIDKFESKYNYKPIALPTAIDTLAVYVHKDNPLAGLSFQQIDAVFSKDRTGGAAEDITTWGQLGLTGEWADKPISLYGRNAASGTYGFFKEHALFGGDFKASVKEQPGSSAVVQAVANDMYAIGYSGIGYKTADVRALPLALETGEAFVPAEPEYAYSGEYPLSRFLYVYINYKPGSQLDPLRREFVKYILSADGQRNVLSDGYLPLTANVAAKTLASIGVAAKATARVGATKSTTALSQ